MTTLITFDGLWSSALKRTYASEYAYSWHTRDVWYPVMHDLIVIGHSLGGPRAIQFCNDNAAYGLRVDLLITLDPRVFGQPYRKPANVRRAVNFRRKSLWMSGYAVEGAEEVIMTGVGHMELAWHPEVRALIEGALK